MFKKKAIVPFVLALLFSPPAPLHAQEATAAAGLITALMSITHAESIIKYGMMIENAISTATTAYNQFQTALRMEKMAHENLKSVSNINSYKDAMAWTNRQLNMERAAIEAIKKTKVSIGNTATGVKDIADLLDSPERWEVSESERSRIYQRLGLSAANYAYLKTWQKIEVDMFDKAVGMVDAYKEKRKQDAGTRAEMAEKYENSGEEGITANALAKDQNMLAIESISVQEDIRDELADMNKRAAIEAMEKRSVPEKPRVSETFSLGLGSSPVNAEIEELDDIY